MGGRGGGYGGRGGGYGGGGQFGGGASHFGGGAPAGGQATEYVSVPADKVGLIIGKGGETIKNINQSSGAYCQLDRNAPDDAIDKNFVVTGAPDAVENAKNMILQKLQPRNVGGYGAETGGNWGGDAAYGGQQVYGGAPAY